MDSKELRLQKFMSGCGVCSRRKAEELILQGKVKVNGKIANLGDKINPYKDKVEVQGKIIKQTKEKRYIMLHKPRGFVTTMSDEIGRKDITMLTEDIDERVYPVGRLDINTEGLLLLSNDGDFTLKVTHPKNKLDKVYQAVISGIPNHFEIEKLQRGVYIDGKKTAPAKAELISADKTNALVELTIHEGRNRQVRKMFEAIGYKVIYLKRVAIGNVVLGNLPLGKWRHLNPNEVKYLMGK